MNYEDKPAVVVLTVEKYNQLISGSASQLISRSVNQEALPLAVPTPAVEPKKVLVTGGAGYIGAHLVGELVKSGYQVVILDNLSTGKKQNIHKESVFIEGDLDDENLLKNIFASHKFEAVFHMAASLEVEESVALPEKYFKNNVINTYNLLKAMKESDCKKIIFSSTAAVYGEAASSPIAENSPLHPANPYGSSKLLAERAIKYFCEFSGFQAVVFRYFNACGFDIKANILPTHQSHLIYNILQVAKGARPFLEVYGNTYPTFDGTCIRDYVHVQDIVVPHVLALMKMAHYNQINSGSSREASMLEATRDLKNRFEVYNIGTGKGYSVAQVVSAASEVLNKIIPMEVAAKRAGDAATTVADNTKLLKELGYQLQFSSLENMIGSSWEVMNLI